MGQRILPIFEYFDLWYEWVYLKNSFPEMHWPGVLTTPIIDTLLVALLHLNYLRIRIDMLLHPEIARCSFQTPWECNWFQLITHPPLDDDDPLNFAFNSFSTKSYDLAKWTLSGSALKSWSCTSLLRTVTKYRNFFTDSWLRSWERWTAVILSCRPTVLPLGAPNPVSRRCSRSFVARITSSKSFLYWT